MRSQGVIRRPRVIGDREAGSRVEFSPDKQRGTLSSGRASSSRVACTHSAPTLSSLRVWYAHTSLQIVTEFRSIVHPFQSRINPVVAGIVCPREDRNATFTSTSAG